MLLLQHARGERVRRVIVEDSDGGLRDNRPLVHFGHNKMHRAAVDFDAIGKGALMRMQSAISGQKGRMDVDEPLLPGADEIRRQQPHEAGEADQFDPVQIEKDLHRLLELVAPGIDLMIDGGGRNSLRFREGETFGFGAVGEDERDFGRIIGRFAPPRPESACWSRDRK